MSPPISLTIVNNLKKFAEQQSQALDAVRQTLSSPDRPLNDFLVTKSNLILIENKIVNQRRKYRGNSNYTQAYTNIINNKTKFILPRGRGQKPAPNSLMWNEKKLITNYHNYENGQYVVGSDIVEELFKNPILDPPKKEEPKKQEPKVEVKEEEKQEKTIETPERKTTERKEEFIKKGEEPPTEDTSNKKLEELKALAKDLEGDNLSIKNVAYRRVLQLDNVEMNALIRLFSEDYKNKVVSAKTAMTYKKFAEDALKEMSDELIEIKGIVSGLESPDENTRSNALKKIVNNEDLLTDVFNGLDEDYFTRNKIPYSLEAFQNYVETQVDILLQPQETKEPDVVIGEAIEGAGTTQPTSQPTTQPTSTTSQPTRPIDEDRRAGGGGIAGMDRIAVVEGTRTGEGQKGVDIDGDGIPDAPFVDLDGDGVPDILPQGTQQLGKRVQEEDEQRATFTIDRLKEEIRAYHLVYENNIKEFGDKKHKAKKDKALKSKKIEEVRKHHKHMEFMIARYFKSEPTMRLGVIIDAEEYLSGLFGGSKTLSSLNSETGISKPKSLIHNTYISGGLAVAQRKPITNRLVRTVPEKPPSQIEAPEKRARVDTFRPYTLPRSTPQRPLLNIKFKSGK